MIPKRPLVYLTLPGIALMLGLLWFRRKKNNIHCDTGGKSSETQAEDEIHKAKSNNRTLHQSKSMTIQLDKKRNNNTEAAKICKSAPIDINPRRGSPVKITDQQIDMDILKIKIADNEQKTLNSIEENDCESFLPELPDSIDRKKFSFSLKKTQKQEPVIIKATTAPKISPKHSFAESKYIKSIANDDNDCNKVDDKSSAKTEYINGGNQQTDLSKCIPSTPVRNPPISSPPLSVCSVQSADSGKGSSPPHSESSPPTTYEFVLPQSLIGQLLGRKGSHVHQIKSKTGANILIKLHPDSNKTKICAVEGTQTEIDAALLMIRKKLPLRRYPNLTLDRVYYATTTPAIFSPIVSPHLNLHLIEGINNDVSVCSIVSEGHIFLHQPLHPSYPSLSILQKCMDQSYLLGDSPILNEISDGIVCAGHIQQSWVRIEIIGHDTETQHCVGKYLDYGGYCSLPFTELRQIRTDFMTIPFQAIECVLGNLAPQGNAWSKEALEILSGLTQSLILQAQVIGYTCDGLPEVHLYARLAPNKFIFINNELVARQLAIWIDDTDNI